MNLEHALQQYGDFKVHRPVAWKLRPYLEMLDEGDHVGAYLIGALGRREEYRILRAFTNGTPLTELVTVKKSSSPDEIGKWIEYFVDAMLDKFLELNRYCPFCSFEAGGHKGGLPYPLSSKACVHRELEGLEEEEEDL